MALHWVNPALVWRLGYVIFGTFTFKVTVKYWIISTFFNKYFWFTYGNWILLVLLFSNEAKYFSQHCQKLMSFHEWRTHASQDILSFLSILLVSSTFSKTFPIFILFSIYQELNLNCILSQLSWFLEVLCYARHFGIKCEVRHPNAERCDFAWSEI